VTKEVALGELEANPAARFLCEPCGNRYLAWKDAKAGGGGSASATRGKRPRPDEDTDDDEDADDLMDDHAGDMDTDDDSDGDANDGAATTVAQAADIVELRVGGLDFALPRGALTAFPTTMLGTMFSDSNRALWEGKAPYIFDDHSAAVFEEFVTPFYLSNGRLLAIPNNSSSTYYLELDFWQIAPGLSAAHALAASSAACIGESLRELQLRLAKQLIQRIDVDLFSVSQGQAVVLSVPALASPGSAMNAARLWAHCGPLLAERLVGPHFVGCGECSDAVGDIMHGWGVHVALQQGDSPGYETYEKHYRHLYQHELRRLDAWGEVAVHVQLTPQQRRDCALRALRAHVDMLLTSAFVSLACDTSAHEQTLFTFALRVELAKRGVQLSLEMAGCKVSALSTTPLRSCVMRWPWDFDGKNKPSPVPYDHVSDATRLLTGAVNGTGAGLKAVNGDALLAKLTLRPATAL